MGAPPRNAISTRKCPHPLPRDKVDEIGGVEVGGRRDANSDAVPVIGRDETFAAEVQERGRFANATCRSFHGFDAAYTRRVADHVGLASLEMIRA